MDIQFTGNHIEVTPAIKEYTLEKISRIKRHFDQVINVHVTFSVDKNEHKSALRLHVKGHDFQAEDVQENLYAAIDLSADKLDRQVIKFKNKTQDHQSNIKKENFDNPEL